MTADTPDVELTEEERRKLAHTFHGVQWLSPERAACVERIIAARLAAALAERDDTLRKVRALADEWTEWSRTRSTPRIDTFRDAADQIRACLPVRDTEATSNEEGT